MKRAAEAVYAPDNVLGAALVVAVVVGGKGPTAFDAGRAAQNMMLAASNEGIGSCPNGIADAAALHAVVGHDDGEQVATVLTFGYPVTPRDPERLRRRVDRPRGPQAVRGRRRRALTLRARLPRSQQYVLLLPTPWFHYVLSPPMPSASSRLWPLMLIA